MTLSRFLAGFLPDLRDNSDLPEIFFTREKRFSNV